MLYTISRKISSLGQMKWPTTDTLQLKQTVFCMWLRVYNSRFETRRVGVTDIMRIALADSVHLMHYCRKFIKLLQPVNAFRRTTAHDIGPYWFYWPLIGINSDCTSRVAGEFVINIDGSTVYGSFMFPPHSSRKSKSTHVSTSEVQQTEPAKRSAVNIISLQ